MPQALINNPGVENNVAIKDDIGMESIKEMKDKLMDEIDHFKKRIEDLDKLKERMTVTWEVDKQVYAKMLAPKALHKLQRDFAYEDDDYFELKRKQLEFKYEMDSHMAEAKLKDFDRQKEAIQEQLKSSQDKLNELEGEDNE